jgi:hypothetical protein
MIYRRLPDGETSDITLGRSKTDGEGVSADDLNAFRVKVCTFLQGLHYPTSLTIYGSTTNETEQRRKRMQCNEDDSFESEFPEKREPEAQLPMNCHLIHSADKTEGRTAALPHARSCRGRKTDTRLERLHNLPFSDV